MDIEQELSDRPMFDVPDEFHDRVISASRCDSALSAVRDLYARLQLEIDRRKPICVASGKCCHFDAYGHRLFITTLELATFVRDYSEAGFNSPGREAGDRPADDATCSSIPGLPAWAVKDKTMSLPLLHNSDGCPFQIDKLCSVHAIRPFGCRIFFCDPTATQWQEHQYELFHAELKQLHETFGVPYSYVEWRQALAAVLPNASQPR
jgi:Fe-S-cluster containining protein